MESSLASAEATLYCCPICRGQVRPESLQSADDLTCPCCGHALWFVRELTHGGPARAMLLTEFLDVGDTAKHVDEILLATGYPSRLNLDLSRLRFLPNSVLKLLLALRDRLKFVGGALVITGLRVRNYNTLTRAHLTNAFDINDDLQTASAT